MFVIRSFRFLFMILLVSFFFVVFVGVSPALAAPCHTIVSGAAPVGYAPPYNVFSPTRELLIQADCQGTSVQITAGNGDNNVYVWRTGYYHDGVSWRTYTFTPNADTYLDNWYQGSATAQIGNLNSRAIWLVAQTCYDDGSPNMKCGCQTPECQYDGSPRTGGFWQLQRVDLSSTP